MKAGDTVDLGENWMAVWVPMFNGPHKIQIKHQCPQMDLWGQTSAIVHPMQKNTHKLYGVRFGCKNCKTLAPKKVLLFLKLHNLFEKIS